MKLKTDSKTIDGMTIYLTQFKPTVAYPLAARLLKSVSPILADMSSALGKIEGGVDLATSIDLELVSSALVSLFESVSPDEFTQLTYDLLQGARVVRSDESGSRIAIDLSDTDSFDDAFVGSIPTMLKAAVFSAGFNFADFLSGVSLAPSHADADPGADNS